MIQIAFLFILFSVHIVAEDPYADLNMSQVEAVSAYHNKPQLADELIGNALSLNQQGKETEALSVLREGVRSTDFKNVKIRYFLAKQYVLLFKSEALRTATNRESLANHILFVQEFIKSSAASASEKEYFEAGLNQIRATASEYGLEKWIPGFVARVSYDKMKQAATGAYKAYQDVPAACYKTSVYTAELAGPAGNGWTWKGSTNRRNQSMLKLKEAIDGGELLPGMVLYVNYNPGTDPSSMNLANGPHWFTYLGKDPQGIDRFSDQYTDNSTLEAMIQFVPGRFIDEIFDPFAK